MTGCLWLPFVTNYGLLELSLVSASSSVLPIPAEPTIVLLLSENVSPSVILLVLIPASVLSASVGYLLGKYGICKICRIIPPITPNAKRWFGLGLVNMGQRC